MTNCPCLTHWGRVTHICVGKLTIIGSENGLTPSRRQAIIWTNAGLLSNGTLRTYFSDILIKIQQFSLKKMHLKMSSVKRRLCRLGLNVLTWVRPTHTDFDFIKRDNMTWNIPSIRTDWNKKSTLIWQTFFLVELIWFQQDVVFKPCMASLYIHNLLLKKSPYPIYHHVTHVYLYSKNRNQFDIQIYFLCMHMCVFSIPEMTGIRQCPHE